MAYIPVRVPVPTPKTKKGLNTFRLVVVSIMLAVMLIACIALATTSGATVYDLTTYDAMKSGEVYFFQNLCVVDSYGEVETTYDNDSKAVTEQCYLVSFNDQNGQLCYASLGVKAGSPIYEQCAAYVKDASQQIGSLVLSGCFKLNTMESQMDQMEREYKNTCEQAKQYFGYTAEETSFHLNYEDATKEGYLEQNSNNALIGACITGSFAVLFAVLLFFILRQRKKIKAAEQMVAGQFQQGFGVDIQNYPPAPQNPTYPQNPVEPQNPNYPQSFQ